MCLVFKFTNVCDSSTAAFYLSLLNIKTDMVSRRREAPLKMRKSRVYLPYMSERRSAGRNTPNKHPNTPIATAACCLLTSSVSSISKNANITLAEHIAVLNIAERNFKIHIVTDFLFDN